MVGYIVKYDVGRTTELPVLFDTAHVQPVHVYMTTDDRYPFTSGVHVYIFYVYHINSDDHKPLICPGRYMRYSRAGERGHEIRSVVPSFEHLRPGDRVGLKKTTDQRVLVYYNCELTEVAFERVPDVSYSFRLSTNSPSLCLFFVRTRDVQ